MRDAVARVLAHYPRIFFACHVRHRRDPKTRRRLSAHQGSILDHLDDVEALTLTDLARHIGVTPGTMSLSVDRLQRKGFLTRGHDPRDGRRVLLRLTAAGVRVKEAQQVLEPERVRGMLEVLSPEEREAGLAGLVILARAAQEYIERGPARKMRLRDRSHRERRT